MVGKLADSVRFGQQVSGMSREIVGSVGPNVASPLAVRFQSSKADLVSRFGYLTMFVGTQA
jgi:hypothetical protein